MTAYPQRLQFFYSRGGWDMDVVSQLVNGLPAKRICGATNFSTPYDSEAADPHLRVQLYRDMVMNRDSRRGRWIAEHVHELKGHNLFCICAKGRPCHGDVLIELANGKAEGRLAV